MIVRDEEDVLARCLNSISGVMDEIIIVDTGSKDRTIEIAKQYTDKIETFRWCDNFAAARNFAFSKASMDYVCWLDADDVLDENNRRAFLKLKEELSADTDIVMMRYEVAFDENNYPIMSYYRERLMRRKMGFEWVGAVHEVIVPRGKMLYSDITVQHRKMHEGDRNRNLRIYERLIADGVALDARQQFYYARELFAHARYTDAIAQLEAFLDNEQAWKENCIDACSDLAGCYYHLGNDQKMLQSLFRSFCYDTPRAEICCKLGKHFLENENIEQAIYWYQQATQCKKKDRNGGFTYDDCYGFIPNIQLCVCYDRIGEHETAQIYNEKAAKFKPDNPAVLHNRQYFLQLHKTSGISKK